MAQVSGNGSAIWTTTFDGGAMSQGPHIFTATAVDSRGFSHTSETAITIDNTPSVTLNPLGLVLGRFDITGSASFKQFIGGAEGTVYVRVDQVGYGSKTCEGKSINWSYAETQGIPYCDAGITTQGEHIVRVWAVAHNGARSEEVTGTFRVDNTPTVSFNSPGLVQGKFDLTGVLHSRSVQAQRKARFMSRWIVMVRDRGPSRGQALTGPMLLCRVSHTVMQVSLPKANTQYECGG